jgi:hypothetical protein
VKYAIQFSILFATILAAGSPALAHHSFSAEFDGDKPVKMTGSVTKVEWENPHVRFYIDVKDDQGNVANWNVELGPPNILKRLGWGHDSLKVGDQVSVNGYVAKDGSKMANAKKVTLADGRSVFAGSSNTKQSRQAPSDQPATNDQPQK